MNINDKMKRDWNRRARVDPKYWVVATEDADECSYRTSAANDVAAFLDGLGDRVSSAGHVLDLGCGIGRMTAPLAEHFASVIGVDVADEMIKDAKALHAHVANLSFQVNDGSSLADFSDSRFDLVLSYSVLPHLPMAVCEAYFREVHRILKPSGWFRYQFWVGNERRMDDSDTLNIRVYSKVQFEALNQVTGFRVDECEVIDYYDPVLELKPLWVTAQKDTVCSAERLFRSDQSKTDGNAEMELEYGLLLYLAFKHLERGETDDAERVFKNAIVADPDQPDAYIQWATIRVEQNDTQGGLAIFENLCEKVPDFAPAWLFRAQLHEALDQRDTAKDCVKRYESIGITEELTGQCAEIKARLKM